MALGTVPSRRTQLCLPIYLGSARRRGCLSLKPTSSGGKVSAQTLMQHRDCASPISLCLETGGAAAAAPFTAEPACASWLPPASCQTTPVVPGHKGAQLCPRTAHAGTLPPAGLPGWTTSGCALSQPCAHHESSAGAGEGVQRFTFFERGWGPYSKVLRSASMVSGGRGFPAHCRWANVLLPVDTVPVFRTAPCTHLQSELPWSWGGPSRRCVPLPTPTSAAHCRPRCPWPPQRAARKVSRGPHSYSKCPGFVLGGPILSPHPTSLPSLTLL